MRQIVIFISLLPLFVNAQTNTTIQGTTSTLIINKGWYRVDSGFTITVRDTTAYNGNLVIRPADASLYWKQGGTWRKVATVTGSGGAITWGDTLTLIATKNKAKADSIAFRLLLAAKEDTANKVESLIGYTANDTTYPTTRAVTEWVQVDVLPYTWYAYDRTIDSIDISGDNTKSLRLYRHSLPNLTDSFADKSIYSVNGTLSSGRTVNANGNSLAFVGISEGTMSGEVLNVNAVDGNLYLNGSDVVNINGTNGVSVISGTTNLSVSNTQTSLLPRLTLNGRASIEAGINDNDAATFKQLKDTANSRVLKSTELTINGVTQNLSQNRTWTVPNLYNSDGALTGTRLVNGANFEMSLFNLLGFTIDADDITLGASSEVVLAANEAISVSANNGVHLFSTGQGVTLLSGSASYASHIKTENLTEERENQMPNSDGVLAVKVNGIPADNSGNVTIPPFDTSGIYSQINQRVKYTDTAAMLLPYGTAIGQRVKYSDTTAMLAPYLRKADTASLSTRIDQKIPLSQKGVANGVCPLDPGGKISFDYLPASVLIYKGVWNASTNTPVLTDGIGTLGWVYKSTTYGIVNFGSHTDTFQIGDWAIYNGTIWEKSPNSNLVMSVNGFQGVVVLTTTNINEGSNLYFTTARARQSISATGDINYNSSTGIISGVSTFNGQAPSYYLSRANHTGTQAQSTVVGLPDSISAHRTAINGKEPTITILPVSKGGSGAGTLTGYIKGNGTNAFTASATIPFTDITGYSIPSLQQVRDVNRNVTEGTGTVANPWMRFYGISNTALLFYPTAANNQTLQTFDGGGGYGGTLSLQPTAGLLTYGGNEVATKTWALSQGWTTNAGTVTSVALNVPTGLTITSGSPITGAGTINVGLQSGYSIPTTTDQTNWTAAYNDKINSAGFTGTSTKTLTLTQQDGGTVTANFTDLNTGDSSLMATNYRLDTVKANIRSQIAALPTYAGSTSITLVGNSFQRSALTGDVTASANSNATTIANNAVTTAKINDGAVTDAKINTVSWSKVTDAPTFATADSTIWQTKYRSDTSRTNIYTAIGTKQNQLNGIGFVKASGTTITYDNSTYLTAEVDGSTTNELQNLGTGTVTTTTYPLTISNGTGTTINGATSSQAGLMVAVDKTKLDGIAAGAEVNVNADWNAVSGDAQILNKPTIPAQVNITAGTGISTNGTYPNITITNTGVINETDPLSIRKAASTQSNWNFWDGNASVFKVSASSTGAPFAWGDWTVINFARDANTGFQMGQATGGSDEHIYIRRNNSGTLGSHNKIPWANEIPAQFAPVAGTGISITGTYPALTIANTGDLSTTNEVQSLGLGTATATTQPLTITLGGTGTTLGGATASLAGLMIASDKSKLDGIAAGAEVNVNPDWNATTGDANILNKPTPTGIMVGVGTAAYTGVAGTALQILRRNSANTAYEFVTPTLQQTVTTSTSGHVRTVTADGPGFNSQTDGSFFVLQKQSGYYTHVYSSGVGLGMQTSDNLGGIAGTIALQPSGGSVTVNGQAVATTNNIGNGTLNMSVTGIGSGSASFQANQTGNTTFTVSLPSMGSGPTNVAPGSGGTGYIQNQFTSQQSADAYFDSARVSAVRINGLAGAGTRMVVTDGNGNLSAQDIPSTEANTYPPTLSSLPSGTFTAEGFTYMRIRNVVHVSGRISFSGVTAGPQTFRLSLPVTSDFVNAYDCTGHVTGSVDGTLNYVNADVTNNDALVNFITTGLSGAAYISFQYAVQ